MGNKFIKNVVQMASGKFFLLLYAIISLPIYIRAVGLSDYAILGIVFSFFRLISEFDLPFFLTLIKSRHDPDIKKNIGFRKIFNTLFNFILLTNIIIFIPILLLGVFLSYRVYNNPDLVLFYLLALGIFMIGRINGFLEDFLRGRKEEGQIQKSIIVSTTIEFLFALIFLFVFNLGVMSIFLSALINVILLYVFLIYFTKKIVRYSFYFHFPIIIQLFKKYTLHEYIFNFTDRLVLRSGFFISTFFLPREALGILTIFFSLEKKISRLTSRVLFRHLTPIFSHLSVKKQFYKVKRTIQNTTFFLLLFSIFFIVFLVTIGKPIYSVYLGAQLKGTFSLFLLFILGALLYTCITPSMTYFFVSNPYLLIKINIFTTIFFLTIFIILIKAYGILGVIMAYLIYFYVYVLVISFVITKSFKNILFGEKYQIGALLLFQIIVILIYTKNILLVEPLLMLLYFFIALILVAILNFKRTVKEFKYLLSI